MIEIATPTSASEVLKAAAKAVGDIEKQFGKGAIGKLGDKPDLKIPVISTGVYDLDYEVLGVGGFPKGRIVEVYGPESSGKTTLLLTLIAAAQRAGGLCAFVDAEHALDAEWALRIGVDVPNLYLAQPNSGEEALRIAETLIDSGAFTVVGIDSVAALVPQAELDGEIGDAFVGVQARLMSQAMRKLTGKVSRAGTCLVFINQIREKIGVMFGSPETTAGGRALKFYASVRLDIRRQTPIKEGEVIVGNKTKIKAVKNKVAAPFREAEVSLLYESGFDTDGSVFDAAVRFNVIDKAGSWFNYAGDRLGQGRTNALLTFVSKGLVEEVLNKVRQKADGTALSATAVLPAGPAPGADTQLN